MPSFFRRAALAGATALLLAASPAQAQDLSDPDRVVARVNGEAVTVADVVKSAEELPEQYRQQIGVLFPALTERVIDQRLVEQAATAAGLEDDPEVLARIEATKLRLMQQVYLERMLDDRLTEERIAAAYADYRANNPAQPEFKARHILVESEEEAQAIIAQLDAGADFATLAQEKSTGPSGPSGGDLGWFGPGQMVPPFDAAVQAMEAGDHSAAPVQTQFGWHVILLEDRQIAEPDSLEAVRDQLVADLTQEIVEEELGALREKAEIEMIE